MLAQLPTGMLALGAASCKTLLLMFSEPAHSPPSWAGPGMAGCLVALLSSGTLQQSPVGVATAGTHGLGCRYSMTIAACCTAGSPLTIVFDTAWPVCKLTAAALQVICLASFHTCCCCCCWQTAQPGSWLNEVLGWWWYSFAGYKITHPTSGRLGRWADHTADATAAQCRIYHEACLSVTGNA